MYLCCAGVCQRPWRKMLRIDETGNVLEGSVDAVRDAALEGSLLRVVLNALEVYSLNIENVNVRDDHLCGESVWHVTHNGTHVSTTVAWVHMLLCTTGEAHVVQTNFSRPPDSGFKPNASTTELTTDALVNFGKLYDSRLPMTWYVKRISCDSKPVYSHYLDGSRVTGSFADLHYMAHLGEVHCVMRDRGYAFFMNNIVVTNDTVNGQSLNHLGQQFTTQALTFKSPPYYWFSSWSTDGKRDNSRWFVGTAQPRGHNNDYVALDWYVDSCWRLVYENDQYGLPKSGSLDELILMISLGHRVRVMVDDTVVEANSIRVTDGFVIAQTLEEMGRRRTGSSDNFFFNTEAMWKWSTIHTTGTVRDVYISVNTMKTMRRDWRSTSVRWMVDTRSWKRMLSTNNHGQVTSGQVPDLIAAVTNGASIRFNLQQDVAAGFFFTNADNVRVDNGVVFAQCLRHISDKRSIKANEYEIQLKPFYWFLMISSLGDMAMSAWHVEMREQLYDSVAPEANITWFASF